MGDRTSFQITIYDCPAEQAGAVLDALDNHNIGVDWGSPLNTQVLFLGESYNEHEASCGTSDEMARELMAEAPGASWELWEDPKYEWLGAVWRYTPELGSFTADCDANGTPYFSSTAVWEMLGNEGPDRVRRLLGLPWEEALAKYTTSSRVFAGKQQTWEYHSAVPRLEECGRCGGPWGEDSTCLHCCKLMTLEEANEGARKVVAEVNTDLVIVVRNPITDMEAAA